VCGSHCAAEVRAKELCLGRMRYDAEAVVVEANRPLLRVGTRTVRARDFGCGRLVASGMEMAKVLDHMRDTGTKELVRLLVSAVGKMAREKQLAGSSAVVGKMVQEKVLGRMLDNLLAVQEKQHEHIADNLWAVLAKLRESIDRSLWVAQVTQLESTGRSSLGALVMLLESIYHSLQEVLARLRDTGHGTVLAVLAMSLYTGRNAVVEVLATLLYGGCSFVLAVPGTQLENAAVAAGIALLVQASVRGYGSHVWQELVRLLGLQAVLLMVGAVLRASSRVVLLPVQARAIREIRWTIASSRRKATSVL
jgi:hypothetical protein